MIEEQNAPADQAGATLDAMSTDVSVRVTESGAHGCVLNPRHRPDPVLTACSVAAAGWPVLALWPGTKKPVHGGSQRANHADHWLTSPAAVLDAVEEFAEIHRLTRTPGFAVITGQPAQVSELKGLALVALDLDGDLADLVELLAAAGTEAEEWAADTLRVQRTPDRRHVYGLVPAVSCPGTGRLAAGLEWRGVGGYVLLPGAQHPSGSRYMITDGPVEVTSGEQPPGALFAGIADPDEDDPLGLVAWRHALPIPSELLDVITARLARDDGTDDDDEPLTTKHAARAMLQSPAADRAAPDASAGAGAPRTGGDATRRLDGLARSITDAPRGEGNARLNWAAGVAAAICATAPDAPAAEVVRAELIEAFLARPIPAGETVRSRRAEAERTCASGWRWGAAHSGQVLADRHPDATLDDDDDTTNGGAMALEADNERPVGASWSRVDLGEIVDGLQGGTVARLMPTLGIREDGRALIYPGRVNGLYGDSTAGKTWTSLLFCCQVLDRGGAVLFVDFEDDPTGSVDRLLRLGVDPAVIVDRFAYVSPEERLNDSGREVLLALVAELEPKLVVIDSTGESMAVDGTKPNDDDDVARWMKRFPKAVARLGPAVLLVDHVVKAKGDAGLWPIGSQRKRAAITGAAYVQECVKGFSKEHDGYSTMVCAKARPGEWATGEKVAELIVTPSHGGELVTLRLAAPGAGGHLLLDVAAAESARVNELKPRLMQAVEKSQTGLSFNRMRAVVRANETTVRSARDVLILEGYLTKSTPHRILKPWIGEPE